MKILTHFALGVTIIPFSSALPAQNFVEKRGGGACSGQDLSPVTYLGGSTSAICESNWGSSYHPITSLTLWGGSEFVTGIQATYSDNTQSPLYGKSDGKTAATINFVYSQNNTVETLTLYGNKNGAYVRHIRITNAAGDILNSGYPSPVADGYTAFPQNVGAGILYGFQGSTDGTNLNGLGFLFLSNPLQSIAISNFAFPNGPQGNTDIVPEQIDFHHVYNDANSNASWAYNHQVTRTVTRSFMQSTTNAFAAGETLALGIKGISFAGLVPTIDVTNTNSFTWTTTEMYQSTQTTSVARQIQYNIGGTLGPHQGVDAVFIAGHGSGHYPYTSTVTLTLQNGHQYSFQEAGDLYLDDISDSITDLYEDDKP